MWCWGVLSLNLALDAGGSILLKTRSELLTWKQCQVHHRHYLSTPYTFTFPCLAHPDPCHLLSCEASIKDILKAHILNKNLNKPRQDKAQSHDLLIIPSFQGLFHSSRTPSEHTGKLRTKDAVQQHQGVQPTLPGPRVSGLPTMPVHFTCNVPRAKFGKLEYDSGVCVCAYVTEGWEMPGSVFCQEPELLSLAYSTIIQKMAEEGGTPQQYPPTHPFVSLN